MRGIHWLGGITALVAALAAGASRAAGWADSRVAGPFVCRADFSLTPLAPTLGDLARLQADVSDMLGLGGPREKIEIYLLHDKPTYVRYLARYLPNVPYRRALYVKGQGPGMVLAYWSRDFEVDLRHECTHALLHASMPVVPLWLDEGLAQYFEVPRSQRANGHPNLASIQSSLRAGPAPAMETLDKKTRLSEMGRTEYRDAWAWVHFMLHGPPEARQALADYLRDLQEGNPPGLLSARLQQRLPDPQRRFAEHFRSWNLDARGPTDGR
jgi:hypothetical protein